MASIVTAVDPELRALMRLRSPRRSAWSLVSVVGLMSIAVLVQLAAPALSVVQELREVNDPRVAGLTSLGWWIAAASLLLAALASTAIAPRSEALLRGEWGRRRGALTWGLALWAVAAAALPPALGWKPGSMPSPFVTIVTAAFQLLCSLAPLWGLRAVLSSLGRRCQRWRESRQGRQSVDSLLAAGAGVLVFSTAVPLLDAYRFEALLNLARLLAVSSAAILALGLGYLVVNSWWIARSLIRPPALLGEMVAPAEPPRA